MSWLRGRDTTVLSVGVQTFSSDPRFRVMRVADQGDDDDTSDWSLEVCLWLITGYMYKNRVKNDRHFNEIPRERGNPKREISNEEI